VSINYYFVDILTNHAHDRNMNWRKEEVMVEGLARARRLDDLEKKYDSQFSIVFEAIRQLMTPPATERRKIGFLGE
jgi:hypothetical protein